MRVCLVLVYASMVSMRVSKFSFMRVWQFKSHASFPSFISCEYVFFVFSMRVSNSIFPCEYLNSVLCEYGQLVSCEYHFNLFMRVCLFLSHASICFPCEFQHYFYASFKSPSSMRVLGQGLMRVSLSFHASFVPLRLGSQGHQVW